MSDEKKIQQDYYARTASRYDDVHVDDDEKDPHYFSLTFMAGAMEFYGFESVLDIGSGTGRAIRYLKKRNPGLRAVGVEPVEALRQVAHEKGIGPEELVDGDATNLHFADGEFDLVCEFGALHHIKQPDRAVAEMLRVAKKAIFISDSNNFGQGSFASRSLKQALNALGLWPVADLIKTRGKGYQLSEGDGLSYSYSVFNDYPQIQAACSKVHLLNTTDGAINPYRTASHVALLGVK